MTAKNVFMAASVPTLTDNSGPTLAQEIGQVEESPFSCRIPFVSRDFFDPTPDDNKSFHRSSASNWTSKKTALRSAKCLFVQSASIRPLLRSAVGDDV